MNEYSSVAQVDPSLEYVGSAVKQLRCNAMKLIRTIALVVHPRNPTQTHRCIPIAAEAHCTRTRMMWLSASS